MRRKITRITSVMTRVRSRSEGFLSPRSVRVEPELSALCSGCYIKREKEKKKNSEPD